jgi:AraC family transcriptional activator of pobA
MEVKSKTQTLSEFYQFKFGEDRPGSNPPETHFNVFRTEEYNHPDRKIAPYSKKEFFKISLIRGEHIFHYAEKSLRISGTTLMFFNPLVPYQVESVGEQATGYFCVFSPSFFNEGMRKDLKQMPMFSPGGKPAYILNVDTDRRVSDVYERMLLEINSDYVLKYDLLRGYVAELIHYGLKLNPAEDLYSHPNAKERTTLAFMELLERQFPIQVRSERLNLRSPAEFAAQLALHVNHLNSAVKHTTGKTTSRLIGERLVAEAKTLLKHTDWNVSEIGYSLGFEDPAHFNNFFKKLTFQSPSAFRANRIIDEMI